MEGSTQMMFYGIRTKLESSFLKIGMLTLAVLCFSCGDGVFLDEALELPPAVTGYFESGDIIIVSGGSVARTATPYPLHTITQWSSGGEFKRTLSTSPSTASYYYGVDFAPDGTNLFFTIENVDRVDKVNTSDLVVTTHVLDVNLSGTTMRAIAALSDGGVVVAESTTSIEKFDVNQARVATNFPIVVGATITQIKRISGDRFAVMATGNPDYPRIYNNDGTAVTTLTGLGCTTNCDPYDIVELADGRFVVSVQNTGYHSLELFDSNFNYIGEFYKDSSVLLFPGAMDLLANGDIVVCSTILNTCEQITVSGDTGSRVGTKALIGDASLMRQPVSIRVVP
jgi:hypothetical protein